MTDSLPLNDVTVVFQGVEGAYSYAAMRAYFPDEIRNYHVKTFRDAMRKSLQEGRIMRSFPSKIPLRELSLISMIFLLSTSFIL